MVTNYEKIKNMTVEEMAEFFSECIMCDDCPVCTFCDEEMVTGDGCPKIFRQWLQTESEGKTGK